MSSSEATWKTVFCNRMQALGPGGCSHCTRLPRKVWGGRLENAGRAQPHGEPLLGILGSRLEGLGLIQTVGKRKPFLTPQASHHSNTPAPDQTDHGCSDQSPSLSC